jgi:hypothetical protein
MLKQLFENIILNEASGIGLAELKKYQWRIELFCDKIYNESLFTTIDEESIYLDKYIIDGGFINKNMEYSEFEKGLFEYISYIKSKYNIKGSGNFIIFSTKKGYSSKKGRPTSKNTITLSKLKKTSEFGGGGSGSGSGVKATEKFEYLSGIAIIIALNKNSNINKDDFNKDSFKNAEKYMNVELKHNEDISLSDMFSMGKEWINTFVSVANIFRTNVNSTQMRCHRDDMLMKTIYKQREICFKNEGKIVLKSDKWNPGDIWFTNITQNNSELIKEIKSCKFISDLNRLIYNKYITKKLISVSLKKLGKNPKIEIVNANEAKISSIKNTNILINQKDKFFDSIDMYFEEDNKKMQFRAFNGIRGWQGEIKGSAAAHGKIGEGPINYVLSEMRLNTVIEETSEEILYDLAKELNLINISFNDFKKELNKVKNKSSFIYSKTKCLSLMKIIQESRKIDEFFKRAIWYASSQTDLSSVFVKIS